MKTRSISLLILSVVSAMVIGGCQLSSIGTEQSQPTTESTEDLIPTSTSSIGSQLIQGFYSFLETLDETKLNDRQATVNLYTAQIKSGPLIRDDQVIFLYRGEGTKVQLIGDMNNWNSETAPVLESVDGTDLWYHAANYDDDARLDYRFLVDEKSAVLDQFNPNSTPGQLPNSTLVMPNYSSLMDDIDLTEVVPTGTLSTHTIDSQYLNQTRTFFVYEPPGQTIGQKRPAVYINDGSDYLNIVDTPGYLDNLIANRLIPPVVAVFIPPIDRNNEYGGSDSYARFMAEELVPFIQSNYDTDPNPQSTAIIGSSLGGNAALFTAIQRPNTFGLVGSISAVIDPNHDPLLEAYTVRGLQIESQAPLSLRPYMAVGTYETAVELSGERMNLVAGNRKLAQIMRDGGYSLIYDEPSEGHSWGMWQEAFGSALDHLFNR